jgi:hypothetical protein
MLEELINMLCKIFWDAAVRKRCLSVDDCDDHAGLNLPTPAGALSKVLLLVLLRAAGRVLSMPPLSPILVAAFLRLRYHNICVAPPSACQKRKAHPWSTRDFL